MATRANVSSLEAIESFRANLIVYISKARPTLEEVSVDVSRTRMWLEHDVRMHWQTEVRRRAKKLDEAQNALFSAEISNLRDASAAERLAVNKAKRALDEAEEKLKVVKKWERDYSNRVEPMAKQLEKLHTVLANTLPQAIAYLTEMSKTLHAYAEMQAPSMADSPAPKPAVEPSTDEGSSDIIKEP